MGTRTTRAVMHEQMAHEATDAIVRDLSDRRGLKWEWEKIDPDVREEIRAKWRAIIGATLAAAEALPHPLDGARDMVRLTIPCLCGADVEVQLTELDEGQALTMHPLPACAWYDATPSDEVHKRLRVDEHLREAGFARKGES